MEAGAMHALHSLTLIALFLIDHMNVASLSVCAGPQT